MARAKSRNQGSNFILDDIDLDVISVSSIINRTPKSSSSTSSSSTSKSKSPPKRPEHLMTKEEQELRYNWTNMIFDEVSTADALKGIKNELLQPQQNINQTANAISKLQEILILNKISPVYTELEKDFVDSPFLIEVSYKDLNGEVKSAIGSGRSKKEAKLKAAEKLLNLITKTDINGNVNNDNSISLVDFYGNIINENDMIEQAIEYMDNQSPYPQRGKISELGKLLGRPVNFNFFRNTTTNLPINKAIQLQNAAQPTYKPMNFEQSATISSINQLQEFLVKRGLPAAEYSELNCAGPDHKPIFFFSCKVGDKQEIGQGNTKKIAKRISAEKMLFRLSKLYTLH